jgi:DNA primase
MAAVELSAKYYSTELMKGTGRDRGAARNYIMSRRLFAPMLESFRIGYAPPPVNGRPWILTKIPEEQLLLEAGIVSRNPETGSLFDPMEGRVVFPQVNPSGKYVGFVGRSLVTKKDKYLATPVTSVFRRTEVLFRIDKARPNIEAVNSAIVVEGLLDAALLFQVGVRNVVATGTKAMTDPQAQILSRYTNRIEVMFDNDTEGREGFDEMYRRRAKHFASMTWREYPAKFKDPADWVADQIARNIGMQQAAVTAS